MNDFESNELYQFFKISCSEASNTPIDHIILNSMLIVFAKEKKKKDQKN